MACGLPVLSTPVGETAEMMTRYGSGHLIPIVPDENWERTFIEILEKGPPLPLDIQVARQAYDWSEVAKRFLNIYDELILSFIINNGVKNVR
jgi:glycosyltransferase involved in cell wall biosynthesis